MNNNNIRDTVTIPMKFHLLHIFLDFPSVLHIPCMSKFRDLEGAISILKHPGVRFYFQYITQQQTNNRTILELVCQIWKKKLANENIIYSYYHKQLTCSENINL